MKRTKLPEVVFFIIQATEATVPGTVFYFSFGLVVLPFGLLIWIMFILKGKRISDAISHHDTPVSPQAKSNIDQLQTDNNNVTKV